MNLKNLFTEEDAVSPVIGVILMVAITVILAAVIGAFVLGIGSSQEKAPQASFGFSFDDGGDGFNSGGNNDALTISHDGGESVENSSLSFSVGDSGVSDSGGDLIFTSGPDSTWTAGSSATVSEDSNNEIETGDDVTITWLASSGDSSQIIGEGTVP